MILHAFVVLALVLAPARDPNAAVGEAAFAEERWDDASTAFDAAYRNTGDTVYLYARAQAERRAGRCKLAIVLYEQFIATVPSKDAQTAARQYIEECRALLPAEPPPPVVDPTDVPAPLPVPREPPWQRDALAAVLVASGGAAIIAGAVLVPVAYRDAGDAAGAGDDRRYGQQIEKARRFELGGAVALSIGTALVIGGVVRWAVLAGRARRGSFARATSTF